MTRTDEHHGRDGDASRARTSGSVGSVGEGWVGELDEACLDAGREAPSGKLDEGAELSLTVLETRAVADEDDEIGWGAMCHVSSVASSASALSAAAATGLPPRRPRRVRHARPLARRRSLASAAPT